MLVFSIPPRHQRPSALLAPSTAQHPRIVSGLTSLDDTQCPCRPTMCPTCDTFHDIFGSLPALSAPSTVQFSYGILSSPSTLSSHGTFHAIFSGHCWRLPTFSVPLTASCLTVSSAVLHPQWPQCPQRPWRPQASLALAPSAASDARVLYGSAPSVASLPLGALDRPASSLTTAPGPSEARCPPIFM